MKREEERRRSEGEEMERKDGGEGWSDPACTSWSGVFDLFHSACSPGGAVTTLTMMSAFFPPTSVTPSDLHSVRSTKTQKCTSRNKLSFPSKFESCPVYILQVFPSSQINASVPAARRNASACETTGSVK